MKRILKSKIVVILLISMVALTASCNEQIKERTNDLAINSTAEKIGEAITKKDLSQEFKEYWYAGKAEITSYKLEQARYGELREGNAVLIYVTEPFLPEKQVKADGNRPDNIPVLKLNSTKNYLTGIYPYSIMTSSFYPVHDDSHALKLSFSSQEWCGQVYAQLNNKDNFEIMSHSYFEKEGDQKFEMNKTVLENEIWNKIRINPSGLPIGEMNIIPSLEYMRLTHKEVKSYKAKTSLSNQGSLQTYEINYPELGRTLKINFTTSFPHTIESWTDSFKDGFGQNAKVLTSTAKKFKTINSPYWQKNHNNDLYLRDSLGL
ncbi:MAG: septum formation inhibitor Maf [Maribacter sp.]|jgi:hypothetical protein